MLSQENVYYFQRKDTLLLQQKLKCDNLLFIMAPQVTWVPYVPRTSFKFLKHGSKLWKVSHIPKEPKPLGMVSVFLLLGLLNKFNMTYPFIKVQLDLLGYKDQMRRKYYIPPWKCCRVFSGVGSHSNPAASETTWMQCILLLKSKGPK